jgi:hypothetical protein
MALLADNSKISPHLSKLTVPPSLHPVEIPSVGINYLLSMRSSPPDIILAKTPEEMSGEWFWKLSRS